MDMTKLLEEAADVMGVMKTWQMDETPERVMEVYLMPRLRELQEFSDWEEPGWCEGCPWDGRTPAEVLSHGIRDAYTALAKTNGFIGGPRGR